MRCLGLLVAAVVAVTVDAHANLVLPVPRNANDAVLPQFLGGKSPATPCTCANGVGGGEAAERNGCDMGPLKAQSGGGQACLWWSQGCSIHCERCATAAVNGTPPVTPITGLPPHADKAGFGVSYCKQTTSRPWTLPREAWTMNIDAVEGSEEDRYRFNPWRSPGSAPVVDACGQAGGKYRQTPVGGDSVFTDTEIAQMGDLGSVALKPVPLSLQPTWVAGEAVDVAWGMRYNHGGGYQYRICRADAELTEECFARNPLEFVKSEHRLLWNNGSLIALLGEERGVFVSGKGVVRPEGSTWARNPVPRVNTDNRGLANEAGCNETGSEGGRNNPVCQQFEAPCPQDTGTWPRCSETQGWPCSYDGSGQGACSGDWTAGVIADKVVVPKTLTPGKYVLQWRYDCEETAQVWSNCADVNIERPPAKHPVDRSSTGSHGAADDHELQLWPGIAPGERSGQIGPETEKCMTHGVPVTECKDSNRYNVTVPTLTSFLVEGADAAVVVAPGGGYATLAFDREGTDIAAWLNSIGVSAYVLKYRVPGRTWLPFGAAPLMDAQRAVGLVRREASSAANALNASKIGFMGFSAGAHLTGHINVQWENRTYERVDDADDFSCRPDFSMMIYPWRSVAEDPVNEPPSGASALNVTNETPPTFLVQAEDDPVHVENAVYYWLSLKNKGVPSELHVYPSGGHGYGRCTVAGGVTYHEVCTWPDRAQLWMQALGVAHAPTTA